MTEEVTERPLVDYGVKFRATEEIVGSIIDVILVGGGHILFQKYLERKAFKFAADSITEAVLSNMKMCYVAHDDGENDDDPQGWDMEDEPIPCSIDNWARMHLQQRRQKSKDDASAARKQAEAARKMRENRTRISDAQRRQNKAREKDKQDNPRTTAILEEVSLDEEEERLREAKAREEAKKRDTEAKAKAFEKQQEEEAKTTALLHEQMDQRQHTFDSEGNIIWVEDLRLDKLPKTQEVVQFGVKWDGKKSQGLDSTQDAFNRSKAQAKGKARRKPRYDRSSINEGQEMNFTDGFSKLQYGQPPILETMDVKAGVTLLALGKEKKGPPPDNPNRQMSRRDYVAQAEREVALGASFMSEGDGQPDAPLDSDAPVQAATAAAPAEASGGEVGGGSGALVSGGLLPELDVGRNISPAAAAAQIPGTRGRMAVQSHNPLAENQRSQTLPGKRIQKAPTAPSRMSRSKMYSSVGHLGRPPRLHVAPLGGSYGIGAPQPPLGATMGHGLHRHANTKESFYFPSPHPDHLAIPPLRSMSEGFLRPASGGTPKVSGRSSRGGEQSDILPSDGRIIPDPKSNVYRNMRSALFPGERQDGYSGY